MNRIFSYTLLVAALGMPVDRAGAVEGSMGTYLIGSRDLVMGIVPPPGVYVSNDFVVYRGDIQAGTIVGAVVDDADLELNLSKTVITGVAPGQILGGSVGFSLQVPLIDGHIDSTGSLKIPGLGTVSGNIDAGDANGLGDIVAVPLIGWHTGKVHYSFAVPMYLPTGDFETATINVRDRSADAANPGKNRFAVDPTLSFTYLDPAAGHEFDVSLGVTFSEENEATDYQTGAEMHIEATLAQRFANGWLLGVNGGYYQQLEDDSGAGADSLKGLLLTDDLKASFYALGPVASYSTKIGDVGITLTAKYLKQFETEKHFDGESGWLRASLSF